MVFIFRFLPLKVYFVGTNKIFRWSGLVRLNIEKWLLGFSFWVGYHIILSFVGVFRGIGVILISCSESAVKN